MYVKNYTELIKLVESKFKRMGICLANSFRGTEVRPVRSVFCLLIRLLYNVTDAKTPSLV